MGAIELGRIAEAVTSQYDTVNAVSMMAFIEALRWMSHTTGTIHLILDGAGYHFIKHIVPIYIKLNFTLTLTLNIKNLRMLYSFPLNSNRQLKL